MALYLSEQDVTSLLTMPDTLACVEEAFRQQGLGAAQNLPRRRLRPPAGVLHIMGAALPALGVMGYKAYSTTRAGAKFHIMLYSTDSGELLAVIQGDKVGQMRTGAASGIATRYMANPNADSLALIGTGWQAETQLQAIHAVRPLKSVRVFSRDATKREAFAQRMQSEIGITVVASNSAEAAVRDAQIVATITNSRVPVLQGAWLAPGAHINAAGSNALSRAEIDDEVVRRARIVVTDSLEQGRIEGGDLLGALERNIITWEGVRELGEIVTGRIRGRETPNDITLFKSHGIAIEDIATARHVVALARERGVGTQLPI